MRRLAHWMNGRLHYAWVVALVVFLVLLIISGVRAAMGVLIIPLEQDFGWTREGVSGPLSVGLLLFGVMAPFAAALMQRFGVRMVIVVCLVVASSGAGVSLLMTEPWQLMMTWGAMVGASAGVLSVVLGAVVANRWFVHRRGLVLGVFMASMATGQLLFLPALAWIAESGGWRPVAWVCAIAGFLVVPLVLLFVPERPRDIGLLAMGATRDEEPAQASPRENPVVVSFRALVRALPTKDFWLLGGTFLVCGMTTNGLVGTHLIPMCYEAGVPQVMAAGLLAMMGICNVLGTTLAGWASDKWDNRRLLCAFYAMRGVSLIFLPYSNFTTTGLVVFSVLYGLDWLATGPSSLKLLTDSYGKVEAPILFGWIFVMHQIGAALAAWGAGLMRTALGGYLEAFVIAGVSCFAGALLVLFVGRGPERRGAVPVPAA